jgi:hypothetical protein
MGEVEGGPRLGRVMPKGRPLITLDFILKNCETASRGTYNRYVSAFCRDERMIQRLLEMVECNIAVRKLLNHKCLKKEITELYGALTLIERALAKKFSLNDMEAASNTPISYCQPCFGDGFHESNPAQESWVNSDPYHIGDFPNIRKHMHRLVFYDICSGKGIQSFLLLQLFPEIAKIVMVDADTHMQVDHIYDKGCNAKISYRSFDIHKSEFAEFLEKDVADCVRGGRANDPNESLNGSISDQGGSNNSSSVTGSGNGTGIPQPLISIVMGLHLCGTLSTRIATLFNRIEGLPIMVISPCCLPDLGAKKRGLDNIAKTREMIRRNKWSPYAFWTLTVFTTIDPCLSIRDVTYDDLVESEKSAFVLGVKKSFL